MKNERVQWIVNFISELLGNSFRGHICSHFLTGANHAHVVVRHFVERLSRTNIRGRKFNLVFIDENNPIGCCIKVGGIIEHLPGWSVV